MSDEKQIVDTMVIRQDVGSYEPVWERSLLKFWSDGTVTWGGRPDGLDPRSQAYRDRWVGDRK